MKILKRVLCLTMTLFFGLFFLNSISIKAAEVVPTDFTTIFTNSNIDITNDIEDDFGVFRFTNYGTRFVEVTLTATSAKNVSYPTGSFVIKDADYHTIKQCEIAGYSNNAINYNNNNSLTVFLPASGYYFIEINYDMTDITKLELSVNVINTSNTINLFNYSSSEQFSINLFTNSNKQDKISQFVLKQSAKFTVSITNSSQMTDGYRFVLLKRETSNVASTFIVVKNEVVSLTQKSYTFSLTEGIYYIGYFALNESNNVTISMTRNLTSYGSSYLVPDPDVRTPCGSQIDVEEADINIYNRSYRQTNITEGFTRLIYLDSLAPSVSRLDYYWYSSNEDVAIITDYGTVLALPINTSQETVKIMAVYKYDMSKCYVKEFVVKNDSETYYSDPIDIDVSMTVTPTRYTYIDLSNVDVPINMLQYYTWSSTSNVSVDGWGRIYAYNSDLGTTVEIVGTYNYNPKVKIRVSVYTILPTSGYEIEYEPELWNYQPVMDGTNCYAYAFNTQVYPNTNDLIYMQPGFAHRKFDLYDINDLIILWQPVNFENTINKVNQDAINVGFTFVPISKYTKCAPGTYKVALVIDNDVDFHWYRQNPDGTWSHKLGNTAATNLDASGNIIYDPELCDKDYSDTVGASYYDAIAFYQVTPIGNFYQNEVAVTYNEVSMFNLNNSLTLDNLSIGLTFEQINSILGEPNKLCTSGLLIYEYQFNNKVYKVQYTNDVSGYNVAVNIECFE